MFIRLIFIISFLFSFTVQASEITVIELHQNKSLDQLVLEKEDEDNNENVKKNSETLDNSEQNISNNNQEESEILSDQKNETNSESLESEEIILIEADNIFDTDEQLIEYHLATINQIKSQTISKEFINILTNLKLENEEKVYNKIYFIIKKLYEIGEIQKAYNLIKEINLDLIEKQEHLFYFQTIELNYLLSTFKLSEVCELKSLLMENSIVLPNYFLEKTDIFCLTLENKLAEAKLLNSLLKESEVSTDENFQKLFEYMILENKEESSFNSVDLIKMKDLIFLYSAMLRINELPLTEDFIKIDPLNLSIPVILSSSTPMNIRIKAANQSFSDGVISVESISALYQSVDFNSKQFNFSDKTIEGLNKNNELIMAFYYQLANMQIFPEDRLRVILDYWKFSKSIGLEKIAYAITKNIIDSFSPSNENSKYSLQIALAHISNNNFIEASKWLKVFDNNKVNKSQLDYAKFLIDLYENDDLNTIIGFLNSINNNLDQNTNYKNLETIDVLNRFLNIETAKTSILNYEIISDDRMMPSYFLIRDIQQNITDKNNLSLFLLSTISINNKKWHELHPEHLALILETYSIYNEGSLIKPIILEILNDLNIIQ